MKKLKNNIETKDKYKSVYEKNKTLIPKQVVAKLNEK
jgi:hypothetical protein